MFANQICMLYTCKSCPVVRELASSTMEGTLSAAISHNCQSHMHANIENKIAHN